jgi:hypothetical protein
VGQVYYLWLERRLLRYLGLYGLFVLGILICLMVPGVNLRIHHYILALLLLPGTSLQTRPSLLYQGILLGLFVNGIARWDFDSVLQTSEALRNDARLHSVVPKILEPATNDGAVPLVTTLTFDTHPIGVDGISLLINDVERMRVFPDDGTGGTWTSFKLVQPEGFTLNEYIRVAYIKDGKTLDYSKTATLFSNGTWTSGPSA